ncbi:terpene synthase family protein [Nocardia otitidiscaviarum]|uniref:terpene synthase family protein n=1 Tax=Nocardia otitidiscaviarum TaxID=1823 RepID=UPI002456A457|nr:hypothetical protein [Nocardia otitidiscaviarum]
MHNELEFRRSALYDEVEAGDAEWVGARIGFDNEDLLRKFIMQGGSKWAAWICPSAPCDRLLLVANWTSLLFVFDDAIKRESHLTSRDGGLDSFLGDLLEGLRLGTSLGGGPLLRRLEVPFRDLWERTTRIMSISQIDRLTEAMSAYFAGISKEMNILRGATPDSFESVLAARMDAVAMNFFWLLCEIGVNSDISVSWRSGAMDRLHREARRHVALVNDLYTFRKEYFEGDYMNTVCALRWREGLSLQSCIDRICHEILNSEAKFLRERLDSTMR